MSPEQRFVEWVKGYIAGARPHNCSLPMELQDIADKLDVLFGTSLGAPADDTDIFEEMYPFVRVTQSFTPNIGHSPFNTDTVGCSTFCSDQVGCAGELPKDAYAHVRRPMEAVFGSPHGDGPVEN